MELSCMIVHPVTGYAWLVELVASYNRRGSQHIARATGDKGGFHTTRLKRRSVRRRRVQFPT